MVVITSVVILSVSRDEVVLTMVVLSVESEFSVAITFVVMLSVGAEVTVVITSAFVLSEGPDVSGVFVVW